jgi:hypothetical protein
LISISIGKYTTENLREPDHRLEQVKSWTYDATTTSELADELEIAQKDRRIGGLSWQPLVDLSKVLLHVTR